jgi:hypothetical protein
LKGELKERDWVDEREEKKPGKGRPFKIYALKVGFNEIVAQLDKEQKKACNYSAYKTLSMATMLYFYNILGISKSILKDICHQFFTKSYQMYFRYQ